MFIVVAIAIEDYIKTTRENIDLFVLDGTWREAKSIYYHCKFLHHIKKVSTFVQDETFLHKSWSTLTCNTVLTNSWANPAIQ